VCPGVARTRSRSPPKSTSSPSARATWSNAWRPAAAASTVARLVGGQLHGTGQKIGVQVRVGGECHPQSTTGCGPAQRPQVSGGIDGERPAITQFSQVGRVSKALVDQRDQMVTGVTHQSSTSSGIITTVIVQYSKLFWKTAMMTALLRGVHCRRRVPGCLLMEPSDQRRDATIFQKMLE
jgi:hypothetical protein